MVDFFSGKAGLAGDVGDVSPCRDTTSPDLSAKPYLGYIGEAATELAPIDLCRRRLDRISDISLRIWLKF